MTRPYQVLDEYRPSIWKCWKIGRDLTVLTKLYGLVPLKAADSRYERAPWHNTTLHAHVRRRTLRSPDGAGWHQDGDYGHVSMNHAIVLWSNVCPTEIRNNQGQVFQPKPYEVIIINNLAWYHRRPPNAPYRRFLFRQRVEVPDANTL